MDRYVNKQTGREVEAVLLTKENVAEVVAWCDGHQVEEVDALDPDKKYVGINFDSWQGRARVSEGDYLVKDPLGDFLVRWSEEFEAQFEKKE